MPFFSVVIPTYNRSELLAATLDSIASQQFKDYEVIVVDNESTDGTSELIAGRSEKIIYLSQSVKGPSFARNMGIREAKGDYIAFLDSDDLWFPWSLKVFHQVIEAEGRPSFVTGKPKLFSDLADLSGVEEQEPEWRRFKDYFESGDEWRWWGVSSFVVRRDSVKSIGGFVEKWINAEDADFALRMGVEAGFVEITRPMAFAYRQHEANVTNVASLNIKGVLHMIEEEKRGRYPGGAARRMERLRIITRHIRPISLSCLKAKACGEGWGLYWATLSWHISLRKYRYVFGFPLQAIRNLFS
jgi:glycosyltransferase involved in cell wall biosynthesis